MLFPEAQVAGPCRVIRQVNAHRRDHSSTVREERESLSEMNIVPGLISGDTASIKDHVAWTY